MSKPKGKLTITKMIPHDTDGRFLRATIVCQDEAGDSWCYSASSFAFDITRPYVEGQPEFLNWYRNACDIRLGEHYNNTLEHEDAVKYYRSGMTPEAAAKANNP